MSQRQYITTAIDYPNAAPHMGHVLEKVLADVCARWFRLCGDDVRFQIGTDEHGVKIQRTAEKEGVAPKELVDRNVPLFQDLYGRLQISYDAFVRTTDEKKHWPTVQALWEKLNAAGKLEKRSYTGLYCSGCERFMTKKDLEDGKCAIHKAAPEEVTEENYFFTLSKDAAWLKKLLTEGMKKGGYEIVPGFRANETLSLIEQGLEDVSFSRPKSSLAWGIPVPGDEDHVMYVWCDALTNYISGLGLLTKHEEREWWDDATVTHVIGKDISRFHALIWPAMLKHAGVRTPDRLLIHGFLTSEGEKMSKSLGNVVVPQDVIEKYGVDPLRFYLSHEVSVGNDGDFSWERFGELYDAKLRNELGNLLNRVLVLLGKSNDREVSLFSISNWSLVKELLNMDFDYSQLFFDSWNKYELQMHSFDLSGAVEKAFKLIDHANHFIDKEKPWSVKHDDPELAGIQMRKDVLVLSILAEILRHISLMLLPFTPETAQRISLQLNVPYAKKMLEKDFVITDEMKQWGSQKKWKKVGEPEILFPKVE